MDFVFRDGEYANGLKKIVQLILESNKKPKLLKAKDWNRGFSEVHNICFQVQEYC